MEIRETFSSKIMSPTHNKVWCRFYKSLFFGHARGVEAVESIVKLLEHDDVPVMKLLTLESDGPNVNKTIGREMQTTLMADDHVMHNAFSKGFAQYGSDAEQLAVDLFSLFKYSAGRREDYRVAA